MGKTERDEQRQHVRVDLVKLLLDWNVSYLVTEVDAAVCCLQLFIRELLPLAFVRLCEKTEQPEITEIFAARYKGVRWIMHHLLRIPGASLAHLALWWSRTAGWLTAAKTSEFLLSSKLAELLLRCCFQVWSYVSLSLQINDLFSGAHASLDLANANCPACPDIVHHTYHQTVYLQAP